MSAWVMYLDIDTPSQNTLYGAATKRYQRVKYKVYRAAAEHAFSIQRTIRDIPPARGRRRVTWERILGKRQREYDEPNLVGGLKPIIDGMVRAGLLKDDTPSLYVGRYGQVTDQRQRGPALRVTLEEWPHE